MEVSVKYANNIITKAPPPRPGFDHAPGLTQILMVNGEILPGSFHINCAWIAPGPNPGAYPAHMHPYDEIIGFIGTNPDDPTDLGAVAELWIDDEKYTITESFLAYLPKNVPHCPLTVADVKRPILHFDIQIAEARPEFQWIKDNEK
jgi:hypothetical protein